MDDPTTPRDQSAASGDAVDEELLVDLELLDGGAGGVVERARDRAAVIADAVQRLLGFARALSSATTPST